MSQSAITLDRDAIKQWADEHDAVPVREGSRLELVPEDEVAGNQERIDWDTFYREVDDDRVVIRHSDADDLQQLTVADRNETLDRMAVEDAADDRYEIEQRLVDGETITGTVTETTEIQETLVEEATLETEVVDRETVARRVTDVELLDSSCQSCECTGHLEASEYGSWFDADRFLADDTDTTTGEMEQYEEYPFDVTAEVDETWAVTIEEREQYTVETRITDVDVSGTDTVDTRDLEADIDVETIQQQLLDSDIIDVDVNIDHSADDRYDIESELTADDVITTYLIARRNVEREISERRRLTTKVVEGELLGRETASENRRESELVERELGDLDDETAVDADVAEESRRMTPTMDDEGKPVLLPGGDEIGMVTAVQGSVANVDPHPGLTEKLAVKLGWGDVDAEDFSLNVSTIDRITDDAVWLAGDTDEAALEQIDASR